MGHAAFGYANGRVTWAERAWVTVAAGFLIFPTATSDAVGFVLAAGFFAWRVLAPAAPGRAAGPPPSGQSAVAKAGSLAYLCGRPSRACWGVAKR